jgi:methylenetetrahydrofolate--tRNA-(uracil-5-)-methyltransferase
MIPGLQDAQFARLGGLHHNTFLNSPKVLTREMRLKADPRLRFAGQITGVEGYVESAAMGLMAGRMAAADFRGRTLAAPAHTTAMGALIDHISGGHLAAEGEPGPRSFQPMNVNFGLLPPVSISKPEGHVGRWKSTDKTLAKKKAASVRALTDIMAWA